MDKNKPVPIEMRRVIEASNRVCKFIADRHDRLSNEEIQELTDLTTELLLCNMALYVYIYEHIDTTK